MPRILNKGARGVCMYNKIRIVTRESPFATRGPRNAVAINCRHLSSRTRENNERVGGERDAFAPASD